MKRYGEFLTTDEDRLFVESIRRYIDHEVMPLRTQLDTDHSVFETVYQGLVEMGIQRRGFAERYGGLAIRSAATVCAITEEIARGDSGLALHTLLIPWTMAAAMGGQNQEVMDAFIPMFCDDTPRVGCMAITEPAGGCNVEDGAEKTRTIRTKAVLDGDEWVINGEKMWPSAAGVADVYCVVCTTGDRDGEDNLALIFLSEDCSLHYTTALPLAPRQLEKWQKSLAVLNEESKGSLLCNQEDEDAEFATALHMFQEKYSLEDILTGRSRT